VAKAIKFNQQSDLTVGGTGNSVLMIFKKIVSNSVK